MIERFGFPDSAIGVQSSSEGNVRPSKGSKMIKLLSHLSYVEITSPDVEASVAFYVNQVGLTEVDRVGGSVYLRCWGDYYSYSVVVVPGAEPALETMAWRTSSPEALEEAAKRIEAAGITGEWFDGHKIGRAYRFVGPWGHSMTLHWDVERHQAPGHVASIYPDRPEKRSSVAGAPRQLDHVTIAASDVDAFAAWYNDVLGFRIMAKTILDEAPISVFSVLTTNEKSHDLGVVLDGSSRAGRINHYAFWVDTREELLIAADVLMENGTPMEYGPSIHGIGEQSFLYYREPSVAAHRAEHRRLPQLRAGLGAQHLEALARLQQHVPQRRHADVDDGVLPACRRPVRHRRRRARRDQGRPLQPVHEARLSTHDRHFSAVRPRAHPRRRPHRDWAWSSGSAYVPSRRRNSAPTI